MKTGFSSAGCGTEGAVPPPRRVSALYHIVERLNSLLVKNLFTCWAACRKGLPQREKTRIPAACGARRAPPGTSPAPARPPVARGRLLPFPAPGRHAGESGRGRKAPETGPPCGKTGVRLPFAPHHSQKTRSVTRAPAEKVQGPGRRGLAPAACAFRHKRCRGLAAARVPGPLSTRGPFFLLLPARLRPPPRRHEKGRLPSRGAPPVASMGVLHGAGAHYSSPPIFFTACMPPMASTTSVMPCFASTRMAS